MGLPGNQRSFFEFGKPKEKIPSYGEFFKRYEKEASPDAIAQVYKEMYGVSTTTKEIVTAIGGVERSCEQPLSSKNDPFSHRIITLATIVLLALALLFPPYFLMSNSQVIHIGFAFAFKPQAGRIDAMYLLCEIVGILAIYWVACRLVSIERKSNQDSSPTPSALPRQSVLQTASRVKDRNASSGSGSPLPPGHPTREFLENEN